MASHQDKDKMGKNVITAGCCGCVGEKEDWCMCVENENIIKVCYMCIALKKTVHRVL